ncbi:ABC transporter permease [Mesorhizobium sangaii]|uniref:ABC-type nitrate/sulfonate/bicarbonate transport system permease component n=1 Tax=Mesorhizobium sangaii TaxID=505389 RepID=A0A841PF39_9HYPH|nr:ABC transporter permease [Mesorhizobium sangaii]MBB6413766.1 ABC-type nitrate/sulfonate/bicarbonate transport system permease component [Mesorhizobium sangaii]
MGKLFKRTATLPDWLIAFIWLSILAAIWSGAVRFLKIPDYILPGPEQVVGFISSKPGYLLASTASTLTVIAVGFCCGVAAAVPVGFLLGKVRWLERALYPFVAFLQGMPLISVIPVLIIWFGYGLVPTSILVGFSVFFPVLVNAIAGIKNVPDRLYFVTRTMGANPLQTFRYVDWPTTLPYLMSAARIALAIATTVAVVSEFLAANDGLGYVALIGSRHRDTVQVIAVVVITALVGVLLNTISLLLERKLMRKYRD